MPGSVLKLIRTISLGPGLLCFWGRSAGWKAALTWIVFRAKAALGFRQPLTLQIKPRRSKYPLLTRLGDSSDITVFHQIFSFEEYACLRDIDSPRFILDLGANVGYSSAYFLTCFPTATVLAVEPDPENFEVCRANLAMYGSRAKVLLAAAWSSNSKLRLSRGTFGDGAEWATQVVRGTDDDEMGVECFDIPTLLRLAGVSVVDLLKVDIERSELEVFNHTAALWLPQVRNLCIELHGVDCREAVMSALEPFEYELTTSGELTICRNLRPRTSLTSTQAVSWRRSD
jgi:FkbM family methyltransferase